MCCTDQRDSVADGVSEGVDVRCSLLKRRVFQPGRLVMLLRAAHLQHRRRHANLTAGDEEYHQEIWHKTQHHCKVMQACKVFHVQVWWGYCPVFNSSQLSLITVRGVKSTWKPYLSKSTDTLQWKLIHYKIQVTNSKTTWVNVLEYLILTVLKYFTYLHLCILSKATSVFRLYIFSVCENTKLILNIGTKMH